MRERLFKLVFAASMTVFLICGLLLSAGIVFAAENIKLIDLFTPFLGATVLALILSLALSDWVSRTVTRPLERIDLTHPDERDVEEEIKPLVSRLAAQNRQIRSQMDALSEEHARQDKMRREFTANVSHELKTPLTSISGFADLMRNGLVRPEDVQRFSEKIYDETQRLITLVGDIIRLSRLEDSSQPVLWEQVSLLRTAQCVQAQLSAAAESRGVAITVQGTEGSIESSVRIVEEILYNLCDNAVRYNHPGGSVEMTISDAPQGAQVCVRDTGIGIPEEELSRIFERFYRVDKSHSKEVGGTGLGLSIVKHGAVYLGAEIRVDSALGKGTTVCVQFPAAAPQQHTIHP